MTDDFPVTCSACGEAVPRWYAAAGRCRDCATFEEVTGRDPVEDITRPMRVSVRVRRALLAHPHLIGRLTATQQELARLLLYGVKPAALPRRLGRTSATVAAMLNRIDSTIGDAGASKKAGLVKGPLTSATPAQATEQMRRPGRQESAKMGLIERMRQREADPEAMAAHRDQRELIYAAMLLFCVHDAPAAADIEPVGGDDAVCYCELYAELLGYDAARLARDFDVTKRAYALWQKKDADPQAAAELAKIQDAHPWMIQDLSDSRKEAAAA